MVSLGLSLSMFAGSALLLWLHSASVRDMREVGLPAAMALPNIEKRMEILKEQNEVAQLQAALRGGSTEEMLNVYVIPGEEEIDRLLATFDVFFTYLEQKRLLSAVSGVHVGEMVDGALPVSFDATVTEQGFSDLLLFADLAGILTVSDALTQRDIDTMLAATEQENPASVAALEHFLATDLLRYSEEPRPYEEQLRKSFSGAAEPALRSMLDAPRLQRARSIFKDLAPVLRQQNLWPLRLLTVEKASSSSAGGGMMRVELQLNAYVRVK
jgi:hypothetical protein